jgi:excisionase family DNA binding protein
MENPFERIDKRLDHIERLFTELLSKQGETTDERPLDIDGAAEFTGLPKSTLYNLVSKAAIPHSKPGKRLFFFKKDLITWIASYNKKTVTEIYKQA